MMTTVVFDTKPYDREALLRVAARRSPSSSPADATWLINFPLDITYEINEAPPSRLQSRAVAGTLRSLVSSYTLTPANPGTRLDYSGHVEPGFAIFGRIEQAAVERNVARQFQALADEIERQGAKATAPPAAGAK